MLNFRGCIYNKHLPLLSFRLLSLWFGTNTVFTQAETVAPGQPGALERMRSAETHRNRNVGTLTVAYRGLNGGETREPVKNREVRFLEKRVLFFFFRENLLESLLLMVFCLLGLVCFLMVFGSHSIFEQCEWNSAELMLARGGDATAEWHLYPIIGVRDGIKFING